ncbi:hypothetical protein EON81_24815 [bacterium]|nr:MAG: hypothetical protein EON81_24815 [bacterium]
MVTKERSAYTVLADFEAFERFKAMNSGARSTPWSRDREDDLRTMLRYELGADALAQLEAYALLNFPAHVPEDVGIDLITRALMKMGDRDVPRTPPPDGFDFR